MDRVKQTLFRNFLYHNVGLYSRTSLQDYTGILKNQIYKRMINKTPANIIAEPKNLCLIFFSLKMKYPRKTEIIPPVLLIDTTYTTSVNVIAVI